MVMRNVGLTGRKTPTMFNFGGGYQDEFAGEYDSLRGFLEETMEDETRELQEGVETEDFDWEELWESFMEDDQQMSGPGESYYKGGSQRGLSGPGGYATSWGERRLKGPGGSYYA